MTEKEQQEYFEYSVRWYRRWLIFVQFIYDHVSRRLGQWLAELH